MQLEDRLTIETPEGVNLEVTLAGLGSRAGACFIDSLILGVALLVVVIATAFLGFADTSADISALILGLGALLATGVLFGYYLLFETLNSGRTPGKAAFGIRVIKLDGSPLGFGAVAIRTLLRFIDLLPTAYAVGIVSILVNARNQRLGDLAAGTVVVRERKPNHSSPVLAASSSLEGLLPWDTSAVTENEVGLVRRFVERSATLTPANRAKLAASLAGPLRSKVAAPDATPNDEAFLFRLLAEKLHRER
ncbi:MAG TPA: RDD family protein [Acidimicrobiia bacterium]|nr:RDD family protein [Acidimicrobiia bacterium]